MYLLLDAELVAKGLLTRTELIDAIAVGQFTPGVCGLSNGISGHSFLRWRYSYPHLCLLPY
jgi:hypothetical protein